MLQKLFGLVMIIAVFVMGLGPNVLAQYEGWKTYYSPTLKFAIDYPSYSESVRHHTNITESPDEVKFQTYNLLATIGTESNIPKTELQEYAVFMQQSMLDKFPERELVQSVETVLYNGELGYRFTVYDPSDGLYSEIMYFQSPSDINKHYRAMFIGTNPVGGPPSGTIDEMMNTIKFFT